MFGGRQPTLHVAYTVVGGSAGLCCRMYNRLKRLILGDLLRKTNEGNESGGRGGP